MKLASQIFNKFIAEALSIWRKKFNITHFGNRNAFIKIILAWWHIVNVKKSWKEKQLRNNFEEPLTAAENSKSKQFLMYFLNWVETWKTRTRGGTLTKKKHLQHNATQLTLFLKNLITIFENLKRNMFC